MSFLKIRPLSADFSIWSPVLLIALWGHSGRIKPASGTWGSLAALPFVLFIQYYGGWPATLLFAVLCFGAGLWAIPYYTAKTHEKDPSEVVLDEVIGVALTFLPLLRFDVMTILIGFAAFRVLDATKLGPIGWCDRQLKGAWGVIMDDVIAGLIAGFCVYGYQRLI